MLYIIDVDVDVVLSEIFAADPIVRTLKKKKFGNDVIHIKHTEVIPKSFSGGYL